MALISEGTFTALARKKNTRKKKFNRFKASSLVPVQKLIKSYNKALTAGEIGKASQCGIRLEGAIKALPDDKRTKYQEPLDYVLGRIRGRTAKAALAPRQAITTATLSLPGHIIKVGGEGLTDEELREAASHLKTIDELVAELANTGFGPQRKWFADSGVVVHDALQNFRSYLRTRCTRITLVKLALGAQCDGAEVESDDLGQVIGSVKLDGQTIANFMRPGGEVNVSSGLRIFLGPQYFLDEDDYDEYHKTAASFRFATLFHELTHKVLQTADLTYSLDDTVDLVTDQPHGCAANAQSWTYFFLDCALKSGRLPGVVNTRNVMVTSAMVRRKMMGYDDD